MQYFNPYKTFVGSFAPNWLMEIKGITPGAKLCYAKLAQFAGKSGNCYPSNKTLAKSLGTNERQIQRYLRVLQSNNLIAIIRRGLGKSNAYKFIYNEKMLVNAILMPDMTNPANQFMTNPANKENQLRESQTKDNSLSTKIVQRENEIPISYKDFLLSIEKNGNANPISVISSFMASYEKYMNAAHPPLHLSTWQNVLNTIIRHEVDGIDADNHPQMIAKYFNTTFKQAIDYGICHYLSDGILDKMFEKTNML